MNRIKLYLTMILCIVFSSQGIASGKEYPRYLEYPNLGAEFKYFSCEGGASLEGNKCSKLIVSAPSLQCPKGSILDVPHGSCESFLNKNPALKCPAGQSLLGGKCKKRSCSFSTTFGSPTLVFVSKRNGHTSAYKNGKKLSLPNYERGPLVSRGADFVDFSVYQLCEISMQNAQKTCPSDYRLQNNSCIKVNRSLPTKYCKLGNLNNSQCESIERQAAMLNDPIKALVQATYPLNPADTKAIFSYLTNLYTLDASSPQLNEILTNSEFGDFWHEDNKIHASTKIQELNTFLGQAKKEDLGLSHLMLDVYYDRAAADMILAQQNIDQAQIDWLILGEEANIESEYQLREEALNTLRNTLDNYWIVISENSDIYFDLVPKRGIYNPIDETAPKLTADFKDVALVLDLMNRVAEQTLAIAKLQVRQGLSVEQDELDNTREDLSVKLARLQTLFGTEKLAQASLASNVPQLLGQVNEHLNDLSTSSRWVSGKFNILNMPFDTVLLIQGYGIDGNFTYDSYNVIKKIITEDGLISSAKQAQKRAEDSLNTYQYNLDNYAGYYSETHRNLNNQLYLLLGCSLENGTNNCLTDNKAREGSQISQQYNLMNMANIDLKRAKQEKENIKKAITIEGARLEEEKGVSQVLEKIYIQYGDVNVLLNDYVRSSSDRNDSFISGKELDAMLSFMNKFIRDDGLVSVDELTSAIDSLHDDIKNRSIKDPKTYIEIMSALERAVIMSSERRLLDINSKARIANWAQQLATADWDIARAKNTIIIENEKLSGLLKQAQRIITQINAYNQTLKTRYYADPIHFTRLTNDVNKAKLAFEQVQEWLFYAVGALEYKWQEDFKDLSKGYSKSGLFSLYTIWQLEDFYNSLQSFDARRGTRPTQLAQDTISLKKDIFGYVERENGEYKMYPDPQGGPGMLNADEAFTAKLHTLSRNVGSAYWLTAEFSTAKAFPRTNLFAGPIVGSDTDLSCLIDGGNYGDKIDSMYININTSSYYSDETDTRAYLTYGGSSYFRTPTPGKVMDNRDSLAPVIENEMIAYDARFWDANQDTMTFKNNHRENVKANISILDGNKELVNPIYSFKERSVAATGWRLSLQLSDRAGEIINIDSIDDIDIIIKHRYKTRNFVPCNDYGPLLLLLK